MADRNRRTNAHVPAATMVLAVLLTAGSARGQLYQLVELSSLGGGLSSPEAINQQGIVVGRSRTAAGSDRAVRWNLAGQVQDLGALGGSGGVAYGVSNTGVIVGSARNGFNVDEAFVWDDVNGMRAVPCLPMSKA